MTITQAPVLRLYGPSPLRGLVLPAVATVHAAMTLDSGAWKGDRNHKLVRDQLQPLVDPHPSHT